MVVQIKQVEHLERVITFNTDHISYKELCDFIKTYDVNDEEITPSSYFNIEYKLDNNSFNDIVNYYDGENEDTKRLKDYIMRLIKTAYGDEA